MKAAQFENRISSKEYWQKHVDACNESGRKKLAYCRDNELNYDQMMRWQRKLKNEQASSFIPVKIKPDHIISNESYICTLTMPRGHVLKIYDEKALSIILDKWR